MAGAGVLSLITVPVVDNVRLYHVLIDGGARLNVISYKSRSASWAPLPFSRVGPQPVYPFGRISLWVTFRAEENFCMENIQFDVAVVNRPFNAIVGRPSLY